MIISVFSSQNSSRENIISKGIENINIIVVIKTKRSTIIQLKIIKISVERWEMIHIYAIDTKYIHRTNYPIVDTIDTLIFDCHSYYSVGV